MAFHPMPFIMGGLPEAGKKNQKKFSMAGGFPWTARAKKEFLGDGAGPLEGETLDFLPVESCRVFTGIWREEATPWPQK